MTLINALYDTLLDAVRAADPAESRLVLGAMLGDERCAELLLRPRGGDTGGKFTPVLVGREEDDHLLALLREGNPLIARFVLAAIMDDADWLAEPSPACKFRTASAASNGGAGARNVGKWLTHVGPAVRQWIMQRPYSQGYRKMGDDLLAYLADPSRIKPGDMARLESIFGRSLQDLRNSTIVGRYIRPAAGTANYQGAYEHLNEMISPRMGGRLRSLDFLQRLVSWWMKAGQQDLDSLVIKGVGRGPLTLGRYRQIAAAGGTLQVTDPAAFQASVTAIGDTISRGIGMSARASMYGNLIKAALLGLAGGAVAHKVKQDADRLTPRSEDHLFPASGHNGYIDGPAPATVNPALNYSVPPHTALYPSATPNTDDMVDIMPAIAVPAPRNYEGGVGHNPLPAPASVFSAPLGMPWGHSSPHGAEQAEQVRMINNPPPAASEEHHVAPQTGSPGHDDWEDRKHLLRDVVDFAPLGGSGRGVMARRGRRARQSAA